MNKPLTAQELENWGFSFGGLVKEETFHYDTWTNEICGCWMEVTNEYQPNGTFTKQYYELNSYCLIEETSQEIFVKLLKLLKDAEHKY